MKLLNRLCELPGPLPGGAVMTLIVLVSPFVPHVAVDLWQMGGYEWSARARSLGPLGTPRIARRTRSR